MRGVVLPLRDLGALVRDEAGLFRGLSGEVVLLVAPGFLPLFDANEVPVVEFCPVEHIDVVGKSFGVGCDPLNAPRCRLVQFLEKDKGLAETLTALVFRDDSIITAIALFGLEDLGLGGDALRETGRVGHFAGTVGFS